MKVVLINGRKGSGKDTTANYLYEKLGVGTIVLPNARAVKEEAYQFYDWDGEKDLKGRQLLVDITNTGYNFDPYFWEKKSVELIHTIAEQQEIDINKLTVLVPDWRYESTYDFYSNLADPKVEVITLRVERHVTVAEMCDPKESFDVYKSESQLDGFPVDYIIKNNGTIDDLHNLIDVMLSDGEIINDTEN